MKPFLQKELQILNDKTHRITNPYRRGSTRQSHPWEGEAGAGPAGQELGQDQRSLFERPGGKGRNMRSKAGSSGCEGAQSEAQEPTVAAVHAFCQQERPGIVLVPAPFYRAILP